MDFIFLELVLGDGNLFCRYGVEVIMQKQTIHTKQFFLNLKHFNALDLDEGYPSIICVYIPFICLYIPYIFLKFLLYVFIFNHIPLYSCIVLLICSFMFPRVFLRVPFLVPLETHLTNYILKVKDLSRVYVMLSNAFKESI